MPAVHARCPWCHFSCDIRCDLNLNWVWKLVLRKAKLGDPCFTHTYSFPYAPPLRTLNFHKSPSIPTFSLSTGVNHLWQSRAPLHRSEPIALHCWYARTASGAHRTVVVGSFAKFFIMNLVVECHTALFQPLMHCWLKLLHFPAKHWQWGDFLKW